MGALHPGIALLAAQQCSQNNDDINEGAWFVVTAKLQQLGYYTMVVLQSCMMLMPELNVFSSNL